jgi:hypothetical protein
MTDTSGANGRRDEWIVRSLNDAWDMRYDADTFIVVSDSSASSNMGWRMRNVLALLGIYIYIYIYIYVCIYKHMSIQYTV